MKALNKLGSAIMMAALLTGCGDSPKPTPPAAGGTNSPPESKTPAQAKTEAPYEKKTEPATAPAPAAEKKAEAAPEKPKASGAARTILFGKADKKWTVDIPAGWKEEEPSNNMRMLQIRVAKAEGDPEDADMGVFKMSGGGGADANIARWVAQFGGGDALKAKRTVKTATGSEAVIAELEGDYTAMTGAGTAEQKKDYKFLGAIIVLDSGGEIYFKLAGPAKTMDAAKPGFDKMIESFKPAP